jgi:hypothetical protein
MVLVPRRFLFKSLIPRCAVMMACLIDHGAFASGFCAIHAAPELADPRWDTSARALERRLGVAAVPGDCSAVELRPRGGHVELVFATRDGRQAVRELADPAEMEPVVDALLVSLAPAPEPLATAPSSSPIPPAPTHFEAPVPMPTPATQTSAILLGGALGARAGGGLITPTVGAFGTLGSGHWELAVTGQWESSYESLSGEDEAHAWSASGLAAGVGLGRREHVSAQLDLRAGLSLAGAFLHQETHHVRPEHWLTRADGRVGAYAGAVILRRSPVRIRADVAVDFAPGSSGYPAAAPDIPRLPSWATSFALGAETNGP